MLYDFRTLGTVRYTSGKSGFVTEAERRAEAEELLRIPELSSGFLPHFWLTESDFTELKSDPCGVWLDSGDAASRAGVDGLVPLLFRAEVEGTGNYRVKLTVDNTDGEESEVLIFITRRRLYEKAVIRSGEIFTRTYDVNVCEFIPRGYKHEFDGKTVDISVVGKCPRLTSVDIEKLTDGKEVPTLWIAGDSTLTDQSCAYPYCPSSSYSGWGQMLSAFLKKGIAVSNHAHSGLTTQSFRGGGHHAIVKRHMKKGDFFMMQFAHNDQKAAWLKADGGYRERIVEYIDEVRSVGAYPIIVTPLARNSWRGDGEYNDLLCEYDLECKRIGEEYGVPVIGLHDFMMDVIIREGLEPAKRYYYPGDFTHSNDPGAFMCAEYIAKELSLLAGDGYAELASLVGMKETHWDAPCGIRPPTPPAEFKTAEKEKDVTSEDETPITRAEAADILIKAAHFFTVNVYNDMFTDILGHEWYAGAVECAYQNGLLPPELAKVGCKFRPDEKITLGDFSVMSALAYASRNKLPAEEKCPLDEKCDMWQRTYVRAAYTLGLLGDTDVLTECVSRSRAAKTVAKMAL